MKKTTVFDRTMIAPCGMNCGTCLAFLRDKKGCYKCYGCRVDFDSKGKSCARCIIRNCDLLDMTTSKFCYECEKFPCLRLKQLDKRYRTKYRTSFIENLLMIKETGINNFLAFESKRRTCPNCGSTLCVHRDNCLKCNFELN
jgi:hypothetical protein